MAALSGTPLACCHRVLPSVSRPVSAGARRLAQALAQGLEALSDSSREERMVMAGTANLARSNVDFPLSIGPVLEALEEQVVMLRLLSDMAEDPRGVTVSIGRENPYDGLAEASVVATGYGLTRRPRSACWVPPGWTIPPPWRPSVPWPVTCPASWAPDRPGLGQQPPCPDGKASRQYNKEEIPNFEQPL